MKLPIRKWLRRLGILLPWVLLLCVAVYFGLLGGWKDATMGRLHRKAAELFNGRKSGVTEVRVSLLMGDESEKREDTFPIRPYGTNAPTYGSVVLKGDDLGPFLGDWMFQDLNYMRQAMCHDPAYGFQFFEGKKLVAETSICWHCSNFWITIYPGMSAWYGFVPDSEQGKALLAACDALLPYKRPEPAKDEAGAEQEPAGPPDADAEVE